MSAAIFEVPTPVIADVVKLRRSARS